MQNRKLQNSSAIQRRKGMNEFISLRHRVSKRKRTKIRLRYPPIIKSSVALNVASTSQCHHHQIQVSRYGQCQIKRECTKEKFTSIHYRSTKNVKPFIWRDDDALAFVLLSQLSTDRKPTCNRPQNIL